MFARLLNTSLIQYNSFALILWPRVSVGSPLHFETFESIVKTNETYCCLFLNLLFLTNFYTSSCMELVVKAGKMFSKCIHTYHVLRIDNITPRYWTSNVASVFQYIETAYIFSISIYFCKHQEYFRFAQFFKWWYVFKSINIVQQTY